MIGKEVYKSEYIVVFFEETQKVYYGKYLPETKDMTDREWKELMLKLSGIMDKLKPSYLIDDNTERFYEYPPDMQEWTLGVFIDLWNRNELKKYVQILPVEIIAKLTAKQIYELAYDKYTIHFESRLVKDLRSALEWIND